MTTPLPRELCHVLSVVCSLPNDSLQDFAHFLQEAFDGFALRVRRQLVRQQSNMAGPTPAQLARLAQFANASQTFFKSLDNETITYLGMTFDAINGREHPNYLPNEKPIISERYKKSALEYLVPTAAVGRASKFLAMLEPTPKKRGAPSKNDFQDAEGPFYLFAYQLTQAIHGFGGRATIGDKCNGTGTLVAALYCIAPFFPKEARLPGFIIDRNSDCQSGMARLAKVKHEAIKEIDDMLSGQKIA